MVLRGRAATSLSRLVSTSSTGLGEPSSQASAVAPQPGAIVWKAAMTYRTNRCASWSRSSSESQATGDLREASHAASSVVFPAPA